MLTSVEAEIDIDGSVRLLEPIRVEKKSRAILTLLDDENVGRQRNEGEERIAEERFAQWIGSVDSGNPNSADNELIDTDLASEYGATQDGER